MRDLLARDNRPILAQIAWSNSVLAFDFDGTLAPIADPPNRARMRRSTQKLLGEVARVYPCIVISGRAQNDSLRRLDGVDLFAVVGNHGIEPWWGGDRIRRRVHRWADVLRHELCWDAGVVVESKDLSVAVHYRQSRFKGAVRDDILRVCRQLEDVHILGGTQAVNLVPREAPGKGMAVELHRARLGCDHALYVGDDETDEDAFALGATGHVLAVRVGRSRSSRAAYFIRRQGDMDMLLSTLLRLRRGPSGRGSS
jgi:trehalose 6-phosphate phosphatase